MQEVKTAPDIAWRAYLAGFFDGEGCITFLAPSDTNIEVRVSITNNDNEIIETLEHEFGGWVSTINNDRGFQWSVGKIPDVISFLQLIREFVRVKKELVDATLAWFTFRANRRIYTHEDWVFVKSLLETCSKTDTNAYKLALRKLLCKL
jgi:hypothetical protein